MVSSEFKNSKITKMKAALCLAVLCAFVALTLGEQCRSEAECGHVSCPENDYVLECVQRQCTCTHKTAKCSTKDQCGDDNCRLGWHCIDSTCRCGFGIGK